jgi:CRISPR/Cas system CMR subunit Cmr4 (Cas7 group RAMP superfamily)
MVKVKYGQLNAIMGIFSELSEIKFPFQRSIEIAKFINNSIKPEMDLFDAERIKLVKEYSEKDSEGKEVILNNNYKIDETKIDEFTLKFKELCNVEIEMEFEQFSESEFENKDIKPSLISVLIELKMIV